MAKKDKDGIVSVEKLSDESILNNREYNNITTKLFNGMTPGNTVNKMQNEARVIAKDKFTVTNNESKKIQDDFINSSKSIGISENTFGSDVSSTSTQEDISSTDKSIIVRPMGKASDSVEELFKNSTRSTLKMQSAMMEQNIKLAKTTFSSLNKMHRSLHDLSTFQRTVQASYYKTSLSYKKDTLEELKKITAILKTGFSIKEESKGKYSINDKNKGDTENNILNQLFSGRPGGVFGGLKNAVRATAVKQASGGAYSDFFDMAQAFLPLLEGMNGKSLLRMGASGFASKQFEKLVGVRQSENFKNMMSDPRAMLSNFAKSMMTSNNSLIKDFFSNFIDGEATSGSTKTFDIKEYMKRDPQGRAVFNNMTQRSITHIIPYHLANIEGFMGHLSRALGDKKDKPNFNYYDYSSNKFENIKDIEKKMGNGAGENFKKVVDRVSKEYTNMRNNPIKDLLDAQGKYQSEFFKDLTKDPKKISIIGGDIVSFCTIVAQAGIDMDNLLNMRTPTAQELISMGVYDDAMDKKQKLSRANVLVRFIKEIKRLKTEDSKWLLDDIFTSVAESLRNEYKKDTDELDNLANNSVSAWAYVANEDNKSYNSNMGKKFGFKSERSGSFDMKKWHEYFKKRNTKSSRDVSFDMEIDQETIEREAAFMSGWDYGMAVKAYYELKHQVEAMRANGEEDTTTFKALEKTLEKVEKGKDKLAEKIGLDNIKKDQNKFVANGYSRSRTKLEFTGDISSDFGTFKKWAKEYMSTTGGQRNANLALSGAAGAAIWKLTSSMGAGKIMAPVMGVIGGSALLMSGKLKGMIDVLGEGGDIMMDNGKSRRENLMARIMQDALPAGLGAATGIKVSNFIKNHLRFGTILGPILGTVTGTAIYAIGKSGLFKGLLKGLTFLPRMLFKKIFGKDAYDAAGNWINEKTGGYFGGKDVPSYREILNATTDSKSLKAAQGAAIKLLDDLKVNELEYIKKIVKPLIEKSDKYKNAKANGRNTTRITEKELDALKLSEKSLDDVYNGFKESVRATKSINEIHDIIDTVMRKRDIINKVNNTAFGQSDDFRTEYDEESSTTRFKGKADYDSDVYKEIEKRAKKFNERFKDSSDDNKDTKEGEQEEGTGGAPSNTFKPSTKRQPIDVKKFMDESGCAAYVASHLMGELTGSIGNADSLYDSTLEYQRGKGIHYSYFTDFAKRLKLRYRVTDMQRPDLEEVAKMIIGDGKKAYHIFLTSNKPGHGHFILVWNVMNDKYMSAKVYDPLRPNLDRDNLSTLLYNTKKVITIFKGDKVNVQDVTPKTKSVKSSSAVDAVLDESYDNSSKLTGSSISKKYAKGNITGVTPIPVVIIGGHLDAVGNIGSVDMEGYKERMRMLAQESSSGSSPSLKKYANNIYTGYSKNKYNDEQKVKQDKMEEYAKENNEIMKQGFGVGGKKDQKDKKEKKKPAGLLGMLGAGAVGLLSLLGGGGHGLPGLVLNGIKTIGGGILGGGKNIVARILGKGDKEAGKSILNETGKTVFSNLKKGAGKVGTKLYEKAFGSVTKEVVEEGGKTATKTIEKSGFLTNAVKKIAEVIPKAVGKLEKVPLLGKFIKKYDLAQKLIDILPKALEKGAKEVAEEGAEAAAKETAKNTTSAVAGKSVIGAVVSVGFIAYDSWQAWKDAPKYFNTPTPTLLQKFCAGLVGGTLSAINAFLAVEPMAVICISLIQMSSTVMGMIARFIYGAINTLVKEKPGSGSKNYTEGKNATYATDENGNIIDNPEHKGLFGGIFEKNTSEIMGDIITGAASKLLPAGLNLGQMLVGLLGGIFNALVGGTSYALSGGDNKQPSQLQNGQGMFITDTGNTYGGNNSSGTTTDTSTQGKGSTRFGGRGDEGGTSSGVGYGTTKSMINGLTFVSQGQFMANKSMNGESLTQNGCAISAMKMVALHLGMKIPDNKLITVAREHLDRSTNAVDISYYTAFGGQIVGDPISVKSSIANPGSAVVLLVYKGEGQHFVAMINKGGNIYLGDPEMEDYVPTDLNDFYLNSFISAVVFDGAGFGGFNILTGRGRRRRLGGRASSEKKVGFTNDQSKLIKGSFNKAVKNFSKNGSKNNKPESLYTVQQSINGGGTESVSIGGGNSNGQNYGVTMPHGKIVSVVSATPGSSNTVKYADGTVEKRTGNVWFRMFNPGSHDAGSNWAVKKYGAIPFNGNRQVTYPSLEAADGATRHIIWDKPEPGENRRDWTKMSMKDFIYTYAPPNENKTEKYLADLQRHTGASPSTTLESLNNEQKEKLLWRVYFNEMGASSPEDMKKAFDTKRGGQKAEIVTGGKGSGLFGRGRFKFRGRGASDLFKLGSTPSLPSPKTKNTDNILKQYGAKPTTAQKVVHDTKNKTVNTNISMANPANGISYTGGGGKPSWLAKAIGENGSTDWKKYGGPAGKWCMSFVNWCFTQTGYSVPNDASSQAPVTSDQWVKLKGAVPGCVIVLARGSGKGKGADQDGASIGGGHSMFYIGPGEGPGATWKVCTGNPQVRVKDYHIAQSGKTFVGYFIPKSALKDLKGAQEIPKTDKSDINSQSTEGGGADGATNASGGGVSANVIAKGKFITSSGKVFNVTNLITGAMQALGKISAGGTGNSTQGNSSGGTVSGATGSLGLSQSQDMLKGAPVENGSASVNKDSKAVKVAEYIRSHVGTTGKSSCGAAVGNGLEAVFKITLKRERDASSFFAAKVLGGSGFGHRNETGNVDKMKSMGYKVISCASTPQTGDIICFNDPKRPAWYGHICCLASDGIWYSFYKQQSFYISSYGPKEQAKFTLWRYNEGAGGGEEDGIEPADSLKPGQRSVLSGLGFKSTANVKMLPREPKFDNASFGSTNGSIGLGVQDKLSTNKGTWNPLSRVSKVKNNGDVEFTLAEFKKSLDKLNTTMLTGIGVNKDILKASVDQMGILGDISKTANKQYKLSQQRIKGITMDGKGEDNFKQLQAKLNEWTNSLRKDYNIALDEGV